MGNKVEMTEVVSFSDELKSAASSLKSQLDAIKKSANQIAEMDSFTGLQQMLRKIISKIFI
ncbi:hypothetical protein QQ991_07570 [Weizmannia coagulans]|uniref:Uncharacterized protein n=3 Tax=Heyndrickxia TaxID=2837504 RepID=G2TMK7_HEYCO|nr:MULTISPECIES: hypothetical protein [Heyndrickxia]AEO99498.1 hypothetical protein Bcoa_0275 [Heyndrickxia coagulans 36D1]AJO23646.1 hypothetical protein SB48_HM08orf04549 [Heyndrickxia coagulans]AKN54856.1 hypothetical protein AB434_2451 [Heyndrickxia coagulans]KGB30962.1 hypothetical protein IE89_01605 [Heyndrickxia coagulans]KXT20226.1 hypothetical protein UZ35_10740 [Heyndrickxia coagulans]